MLYIDADAVPAIAKDLIIKTAIRTGVQTVFVANRLLILPKLSNIQMKVVGQGIDVADDYIAGRAGTGDVVVTNDIALAADVLHSGAICFDNRGVLYSKDTISQRLTGRDFTETLRHTGIAPSAFNQQPKYNDKDKKRFADALNKYIKCTK